MTWTYASEWELLIGPFSPETRAKFQELDRLHDELAQRRAVMVVKEIGDRVARHPLSERCA